jgi:hypothetical protein
VPASPRNQLPPLRLLCAKLDLLLLVLLIFQMLLPRID